MRTGLKVLGCDHGTLRSPWTGSRIEPVGTWNDIGGEAQLRIRGFHCFEMWALAAWVWLADKFDPPFAPFVALCELDGDIASDDIKCPLEFSATRMRVVRKVCDLSEKQLRRVSVFADSWEYVTRRVEMELGRKDFARRHAYLRRASNAIAEGRRDPKRQATREGE